MILIDAWMDLTNVVVYIDSFEILSVKVLNEYFWNSIPFAVDCDEILKVVKFCNDQVFLLTLEL